MKIQHVLFALSLAATAVAAQAGDLYVVAGPNVALSADEVRQVFLGDKQFSGSTKLVPVDNGALQSEFQSRVLKVDGSRYNSLWAKKGFREGLNPPQVRQSDAEVLASVKANPGTVGYVSKPTPDVKVLQKF